MSSKILLIAVSAVLSEDMDGGDAMSVLQTSGGQRDKAIAEDKALIAQEIATADEAVHSFMTHGERVKGLQEIKRELQTMRIDANHVKLEQIAEDILNEDITHEQAHQVALMNLANRKALDETSALAKGYMVEWVASESGENEDRIEATTEALARAFPESVGEVRARLEKKFPPGEAVVYKGEGRDFPTGDRLLNGETGTVLGANAAKGTIRVQFPGKSIVADGLLDISLPPKDLSRIAEEKEIQLEQGANVVYKGQSQHFSNGDHLLPGFTGRIVGNDEAAHRIRVKFDGNRQVRDVLRSSLEAQTDDKDDYVKIGDGFCRDANDKPLSYYHSTRVSETDCRAHCDSDVLCAGYAFGSGNCAVYASYSGPKDWNYQPEGGVLSSLSKDDDVHGYVCMKKMKQSIQWRRGEPEQSCGEVCSGHCVGNAWPQSEEEFRGIANYSQLQCSDVTEGNADHNPSTCHGRCFWKFEAIGQSTDRCSSKMSSCSRLCPCRAPRTLPAIRAEVRTYQAPYRALGDGFCRDQQRMRPSYYFAHDMTQVQCEQQCDSNRLCTGYTFGGPNKFCAMYSEQTEASPPRFQFHQGEEGSAEVQQVMFAPGHVCMLKSNLEAPIHWSMHREIEENLAMEQEKRQNMVKHLLNEMDQFVFMSQREADLNHTAANRSTKAQGGFDIVHESTENIKDYATLGGLPEVETILEDAGSAAKRLLQGW